MPIPSIPPRRRSLLWDAEYEKEYGAYALARAASDLPLVGDDVSDTGRERIAVVGMDAVERLDTTYTDKADTAPKAGSDDTITFQYGGYTVTVPADRFEEMIDDVLRTIEQDIRQESEKNILDKTKGVLKDLFRRIPQRDPPPPTVSGGPRG